MVRRLLPRRPGPSLFARARDGLLGLGESYTDGLPVFVLVSALLAIPLTALVRVIQMFTVTSPHLWLGILGVVPGVVLAVASLGAIIWAFGTAKQNAPRAFGVGLLASVVAPVLAIEATAGVVAVLWRHGAITGHAGAVPSLWSSERYFLWHTLDAIPFLKVDETFGWGEPSELAGGAAGWVVVGLKVLVVLPLARVLASAYWWVRARESGAKGYGSDIAGGLAGAFVALTAAAYAYVIWLWPAHSGIAGLLDRLPASVHVLDHDIGLRWVTPAVQWLVLALLMFLCVVWGLAAIAGAFFRYDTIGWSLAALVPPLLWLHVALVLSAVTTMMFVRSGIATTTPPLPEGAPLTAGVADQVWGFLNAVPALEIPKTTHWSRQYAFAGWPVGVLSLGFRLSALAALLGLLWLLGRIVRLSRTDDQPA